MQSVTAKAAASCGEVAVAVKDNPNPQRMMQRITLKSILKQAGDSVSAEQVQQLNDALQKIKKAE